jgi:outer membrane protein assembly factor BamA
MITKISSILTILALGSSFAVSQTPAVATSKVKIQKITIQRNHVFTASKIKDTMKLIKEGSSSNVAIGKDTTELKLRDDLTRIRMLYSDNGYARFNVFDPIVEVKKVEAGRTVETQYFITIRIEENEPYRIKDIQVTGNKLFTSDEIRRAVGMAPGQVYSDVALRKGFDKLKKMYDGRGFNKFAPDPSFMFDETKKVVSLTIRIQEN